MRFVTGTLEALTTVESRDVLVLGVGGKTRAFALASDFVIEECSSMDIARSLAFGSSRVRIAYWVDHTMRDAHARYVARALTVETP